MIRLQNVSYSYPSRTEPALANINLEILAGEAVCVMGANGSGKSTLARIVAGLITHDGGSVQVDCPGDPPIKVGILFQNPDNQMIAVTVEKEIAFALENQGVPMPEMERRIGETLDQFSIDHLRHRITSELSGGEKQRVALASIMICRPPILILDEPGSFLDVAGRKALQREEQRIRSENPQMIVIRITQFPEMAERYRRLLVFDGGAIVADGPPMEILANREFCLKTKLSFDAEQAGAAGFEVVLPRAISDRRRVGRITASEVDIGYPGSPTILSNLSFSFNRSEIVGLIGPSGSGKSTLGKVLCGLMEPISGDLAYVDANDQPLVVDDIAGLVTGVFQQPERQFFLPDCAAEIAFGPRNFGRDMSGDEIVAMFRMVGLDAEQFADRDPFSLSMGEKRRLAFAAILSLVPDFVIFDEPTCGLDPEGAGRFVRMARALKKAGMGIIIISHDGSLIRQLADRIISLDAETGYSIATADDFFRSDRQRNLLSSIRNQL